MKRRRVAIQQVAAEAGVSITNVSHILKDVPGVRVNPETRQTHDRALDEKPTETPIMNLSFP